jgi:4-amino-4-deoxy-L-arabinose transferase-like glycosyltransferase
MPLIATPEPATTPPTAAAQSRRSRALCLLSALWLTLFVASLFSPPVLDDADGTHANAARQMLLSGDWVTLRVNNVRYLEKAPLPYWITAVSFRVFGFNTFATHLPSALSVLLLMLLGFSWARQAFGERAALYTGLGVLTSAGVFLFTRVFIPDVLLSLLLAITLYCFLQSLSSITKAGAPHLASEMWAGEPQTSGAPFIAPSSHGTSHAVSGPSHEGANRIYPYAMWTALALAVLTKGLVAIVFLFGTAILFLAITGELRNWRRLKPFTGMFLFLAIAAPWHILAGLRNTGGMNGHGFFWFYFINEHVLRFLGRRIPRDYNKLPSYLYWSLHLVWLFPWALFAPLVVIDWRRRIQRVEIEAKCEDFRPGFPWLLVVLAILIPTLLGLKFGIILGIALVSVFLFRRKQRLGRSPSPRPPNLVPLPPILTCAQRTTLLLSLYSAFVLVFFSLSTNQEYYTFPAYLPLLMLVAASLARSEETSYLEPINSNPYITFAHAAFTMLGALIAIALTYGLWTSRHLAALPNVGDLLAHRGVGDYTLSMSSLFDLTGPSFAALRLPAALALAAFALGPAIAWVLRRQRRHVASTITIALTSATFLIAAHIALARFAPMLSSQDMAAKIQQLEATGAISRDNTLMLYGDQAYGSSIPFYLNRPLSRPTLLVDGRSSSMLFGSYFPDSTYLFLTPAELLAQWGTGPRKLLFVPILHRDDVDHLLGTRAILVQETAGKALLTDRPLNK